MLLDLLVRAIVFYFVVDLLELDLLRIPRILGRGMVKVGAAVAPCLAALAPFIPGVGPVAGAAIGAAGGLFARARRP